jgi:antitoxin component YwqK of YwqJK toxin-antitoxin module
LNLQSYQTQFRESPTFCYEVAQGLGCNPIINLEEEKYTSEPIISRQDSPFDLLNRVHAEIQQCPIHTVTKDQVYTVLNKWSKSLESSLHIIYNLLDYLKPIRDNLLIHKEEVPDDVPSKLEPYTKHLEAETTYDSLIRNCIFVFEKMHKQEIEKHKINVDALDNEKQKIVFLQHQIALYDFLKHQIGIHFQTSQKVLQELSKKREAEKNPSKLIDSTLESRPLNTYEFTEKRYLIDDPSLTIHFEELFDLNQHPFPQCSKEFHPNGTLKSEIYHRNGHKHGPSSYFDSQGLLLAKGWFVDNARTGINLQYYRHGQIYSIQRFKNDFAEGPQEFFYPDGTLKTTYKCHEGKKEGDALLYYPSGILKRRVQFKDSKRHGLEEMWYPSEIKEVEGEYEYDRPKGTIKTWHSNGKLAKQMTFHRFPNDFDMTLWNEEGQILKSSAKAPDAISSLIQRTQELKVLLDKTLLNFMELLDKNKKSNE